VKVLGRRFNERLSRIARWKPLRPLALRARYFKEKASFRAAGGKITHSFPIFGDYSEGAGVARGHYFHQDLLVAGFINDQKPTKHLDIGSRIDGFVAHVAAFRPIEIIDIRHLPPTNHPNISFLRADFMANDIEDVGRADSISCLHAIEHFGLGRYSDAIDPNGHLRAFKNLLKILNPGGFLYISFPIGKKNEVHFNAHRVFAPLDIFSWPGASELLKLKRFDFVDDLGALHRDYPLLEEKPPATDYGCGIYTFQKIRVGSRA
jgi:SAM-dependent methyltransferase